MAIAGLTDRSKTFMRLARVKKGEVVEKNGVKRPVDLDHFRITYSDGCDDVKAEFEKKFGLKPTVIPMRLAFSEISQSWDAFYTCYGKGGLLATASSHLDDNGHEVLTWNYYRDHESAEVWVRNGHPVGPDGERFFNQPIDLSRPIYTYKDGKDKDVPVYLKPEGRLSFVVPDLAYIDGKPRVGYFEFCPLSPRDIGTISGELAAIAFMAQQVGKDITGIPMRLIRRKESVTVRMKDQLSKKDSWVVHIEVGGEWGGKALSVMETLALPSPEDMVFDEEDEDLVDGHAEDVSENKPTWTGTPSMTQPAAQKAPAESMAQPEEDDYPPEMFGGPSAPEHKEPAQPEQKKPTSKAQPRSELDGPAVRPYPPEIFKDRLMKMVAKIEETYKAEGGTPWMAKDENQILAKVTNAIFDGKEMDRHIVFGWLFGTGSTKEMTPFQIKAMWQIMGVKASQENPPRYESAPSPTSMTELRNVLEFVVAKGGKS